MMHGTVNIKCDRLFSENQPRQPGADGHTWLSDKMLFANGFK